MSKLLSEGQVKRMLQLVGGDAGTPEGKDAAWDALVRTDARLRRRVAELGKERDEAMDVLDWTEAPTESGGVKLNIIGRIRALNGKRIIEGNQRAGKLIDRADRAETALAAAQEALKWYADEKNWTQSASWGGRIMDDESAALSDCGKRARDALACGDAQETG